MNRNITIGVIVALVLLVAAGAWAKSTYFVGTKVEVTPTTQNTNTQNQEPDATTKMTAVEDGSYTFSLTESKVTWEGRKTLIADYKDTGTLSIQRGILEVTQQSMDNEFQGEFEFDMTSINVDSTGKQAGEDMLEKHLKSPDFFDVENHPTARLTINDIIPAEDVSTSYNYTVQGELEIKGKKADVEFPAKLFMQDGELHMTGSATVDRTKFDVRFGSDNFFDNLGDNVIDDNFTVTFNLLGRK